MACRHPQEHERDRRQRSQTPPWLIFHGRLLFGPGWLRADRLPAEIARRRCRAAVASDLFPGSGAADAPSRAGRAFHSGSLVRTAASVSETVSPWNSRCPVSISYSTTPKAQMSARLSTGLPRACSGAMYAAVPSTVPARVTCSRVTVGECSGLPAGGVSSVPLARPKSSTFTVPSGLILMLPGLRSRCTMPFSCAASSASAICRAMPNASSSGSGPCLSRSASVGPSTSSITR